MKQNRGKGGALWTTNELVLSSGGFLTSVPILVKLDQEMRLLECSQLVGCVGFNVPLDTF